MHCNPMSIPDHQLLRQWLRRRSWNLGQNASNQNGGDNNELITAIIVLPEPHQKGVEYYEKIIQSNIYHRWRTIPLLYTPRKLKKNSITNEQYRKEVYQALFRYMHDGEKNEKEIVDTILKHVEFDDKLREKLQNCIPLSEAVKRQYKSVIASLAVVGFTLLKSESPVLQQITDAAGPSLLWGIVRFFYRNRQPQIQVMVDLLHALAFRLLITQYLPPLHALVPPMLQFCMLLWLDNTEFVAVATSILAYTMLQLQMTKSAKAPPHMTPSGSNNDEEYAQLLVNQTLALPLQCASVMRQNSWMRPLWAIIYCRWPIAFPSSLSDLPSDRRGRVRRLVEQQQCTCDALNAFFLRGTITVRYERFEGMTENTRALCNARERIAMDMLQRSPMCFYLPTLTASTWESRMRDMRSLPFAQLYLQQPQLLSPPSSDNGDDMQWVAMNLVQRTLLALLSVVEKTPLQNLVNTTLSEEENDLLIYAALLHPTRAPTLVRQFDKYQQARNPLDGSSFREAVGFLNFYGEFSTEGQERVAQFAASLHDASVQRTLVDILDGYAHEDWSRYDDLILKRLLALLPLVDDLPLNRLGNLTNGTHWPELLAEPRQDSLHRYQTLKLLQRMYVCASGDNSFLLRGIRACMSQYKDHMETSLSDVGPRRVLARAMRTLSATLLRKVPLVHYSVFETLARNASNAEWLRCAHAKNKALYWGNVLGAYLDMQDQNGEVRVHQLILSGKRNLGLEMREAGDFFDFLYTWVEWFEPTPRLQQMGSILEEYHRPLPSFFWANQHIFFNETLPP